jgi:hypothetical protein
MTRHAFDDSSAGHMIIRPVLPVHMSPDLMQPFWGKAVTVMSSLRRFISSICEQEHTQLAFEQLELAHL